jgi:hypothetical protein
MAHDYAVTVQLALPRPIAAVRVRLPIGDVPRRFADFLNQVYAASRTGAIELDGQNSSFTAEMRTETPTWNSA